MLNMPVEKAKDELANLVKQVANEGETIVLQTADGLQAALVNLSAIRWGMVQTTLTDAQELAALAAADTVREKILVQHGGQPFGDVSQELEALRELRLLELQGVS